ncbi:hypothetical protein RZQ92_13350 [Klebsiella michiganensis]|uniref:hypothetical protein n=1 Tax=Klebsiella michiganensis TaxID=1134687 RepID=UPI0006BD8952|nr:hypothetical protein [Klebsiella michiganensis]MDV1542091.1 hypothetical protein [Klebsiella michiganensis]MDV1553271.1 hypothetical protein [Klebsiella michiganensis]BAS35997.1 uncharacterized protein KPYH43_c3137 [Klebsiella pneumoniae]
MNYDGFLASARRHKYTCEIIKKQMENFDEGSEQHIRLLSNFYYLSGYILECSLKYLILESYGHPDNIKVDCESCKALGFGKGNKFFTHDLADLQNKLDVKISDFSCRSDNELINELIDNWGPEFRYEVISNPVEHITMFYSHAVNFIARV